MSGWRAKIYTGLSAGYDGEHWWSWGTDSMAVVVGVLTVSVMAISGAIVLLGWGMRYWVERWPQ